MNFLRRVFGVCKDRWTHDWIRDKAVLTVAGGSELIPHRICKVCNKSEWLVVTYAGINGQVREWRPVADIYYG